jgi:uncharacterized protein (TIGR03086 family)
MGGMDSLLILMERAAARTGTVVRGISPDQLGMPTPCAEYDVFALYRHLYDVTVRFQAMARREPVDWSAAIPDYPLDPAGFEQESKRLVAAWSEPGRLSGTAGAMNLPATAVAKLILCDLIVHGWDLAAATGQPYETDEETTAMMAEFAEEMAPTGRQMGAFAEPVPAPADATAFEEALAQIGRDPRWTAGK